jgi:DNA polymerase-3 subunit delta'
VFAAAPAAEERALAALLTLELQPALAELAAAVSGYLRDCDAPSLRRPGQRALFAYLDGLRRLQRAVAGGANPQRELLLAQLLAQLAGILGSSAGGAKLGAVASPVPVS